MHTQRWIPTLLALSLSACDAIDDGASHDAPEIMDATTMTERGELVTVTDLNAADLFDAVKDLAVGESVPAELELGEFGAMSTRIERTALIPDGFTADRIDGDGDATPVPIHARSYRATSGAGDLQLDLLIGPDELAGVLRRDAEEYALSALAGPGPDAPVIGVFRAPPGEPVAADAPTCTVADAHEPPGQLAAAGTQPAHGPLRAGNCWKLEVRSHADYEFYKGVGKGDVTAATWIVLEALVGASARFSVINLDIALPKGGGVTILTAPKHALYYPKSSDAHVLLDQLGDFWNFFFPDVDRDLVVLFTGKDIHANGSYSVAGIANVGQVCKSLENTYAVVEVRSTSPWNSLATAHEIGHALGANHTTAGVMTPNASGQSFSQFSRDEMTKHIFFHHACMPLAACSVE